MLLLYVFLVILLVLARVVVRSRVFLLEKKFARLARVARDLNVQSAGKQGINGRLDSCGYAKQQYLLGEVTARRDLAEARYEAWQARSEKLAKIMSRIRAVKGRTVPYLFGAVDAALVLLALTMLGVLEFPALTQALASLFN